MALQRFLNDMQLWYTADQIKVTEKAIAALTCYMLLAWSMSPLNFAVTELSSNHSCSISQHATFVDGNQVRASSQQSSMHVRLRIKPVTRLCAIHLVHVRCQPHDRRKPDAVVNAAINLSNSWMPIRRRDCYRPIGLAQLAVFRCKQTTLRA
jgi:hypothetical protein